MIVIREAKTKREHKKFIQFQNDLYKNVPQYVPTLMMDELQNMSPKKNPAYAYCEMRFFLAEKDGKIVGRVGAIISHKANKLWNQKRIRITRLDFVEDKAVFAALMKTVEDWAKQKGLTEMIGPIGFCDLDKEGMLVDGFERPGMFITYYNHPYYVQFMEDYGFVKDADWLEQIVYLDDAKEDKLAALSKRIVEKNGFHILEFKNKKELMPYVRPVFELLNTEYEGLYGVVPLTDAQIEYYKEMFITLINLRYISFITNKEGELVAFGVCAPSLAEAMIKSGGMLFPFGFIPLLKALRKPKILDMYIVAVKESYRKSGLSLVLMQDVYRRAKDDGIALAETGPQLESNHNVQTMWDYFRTEKEVRRRRSWIKEI